MSIKVLSESLPTAKKEHECMACDFILAHGVDGFGYSLAEKRQLVIARRNKYRIKKGEKYIKQNNAFEGELYTFNAIPEMHDICLKHDLYEQ